MSFEHSYKIEIVPIKQIPVELKMNKSPYRPKGKRFAIDMFKMILIQIICVMMGLWIYQLDKHESSTIILMIFSSASFYYPFGRGPTSLAFSSNY